MSRLIVFSFLGILSGGGCLPSQASTVGFEAFKKTLYPYVRANCKACHGANQAPFFAVSDEEEAFQYSKNYVDFSQLDRSIFLERVTNGHSGGPETQTDGSEMLSILEEWKRLWHQNPNPVPSPQRTVSSQVSLPVEVLPEGSQSWGTLQFDLAKSSPYRLDLEKVYFEIKVRRFGLDALQFTRPRLGTAQKAIRVEDLNIHVVSPEQSVASNRNRYQSLKRTIQPGRLPSQMGEPLLFPVLSSRAEIRVLEDGVDFSQIKISVSFKTIEAIQAGTQCRNLKDFKLDVYQLMLDRNCVYCHGGGPRGLAGRSPAKDYFDLSLSPEEVCRKSLQWIDVDAPSESALLTYPLWGEGGHPKILPFVSEVVPFWTDWIRSEKASF